MKKKLWNIVSSAIGAIFLVMICLAAFIVLSSKLSGGEPTFMGYQVKAVLSGSMEPTFQTGSIISIKLGDERASYKTGDIITFRMDDKLITHRIIDVQQENGQAVYKTKGDNNNGPDLWTVPAQTIIGKYTNFTIPYIGYALNYVNSKAGSALLLIVPGILLLFSAFRSIIVAKNELEGSKA
ncbi:signal peptidase I SipW [Rossellomorea sp. GCM10028870]|uniref:signal peptidase I SipW n=1 Tax=Rossellomorea sp. GCM10028870 TaxID=3273426 RepID=UPI003619A55E